MDTKFSQFFRDVRGKSVAVLGMGVSNTPLIRLLLEAGAHVTIRDRKEEAAENMTAKAFASHGATLVFGENYLDDLNESIIFKTPGMRPDLPELLAAKESGSVITSEMEIFFEVCPAKTIGITGSDGKTTTTTIIHELLKTEGHTCYVGGNIGTPLLDQVGKMKPDDICVLELSSFQLMTMNSSPDIAVITNIAPNHLDVHRSMDEYIDAKRNIYRFQNGGRLVLNADNDITYDISKLEGLSSVLFSRKRVLDDGFSVCDGFICKGSERIVRTADIKIPGLHNVENYLAAIAAVDGLVSHDTIVSVAKNFGGVAHRMELVRELHGVAYYNDSIASSPTRTIAGLRSFPQKVILIAGGYDKHIPFDVLGPEVVEHVKALVLVGATAPKIREAVVQAPDYDPEVLPIFECDTFENAVHTAASTAQSGDIVTLSPACASFDLFRNFAERGDRFRAIVSALD